MIPTGQEFSILYIAYAILFIFLILNYVLSKNKRFYKWNLIVLGIYFSYMIYLFSDPINFKGGSSLGVLLYGAFFVLSHFVIIGLIKFIHLIIKK